MRPCASSVPQSRNGADEEFPAHFLLMASTLDRRLEQHNAGTASRYTRSRFPVTLVYQEEQPNQRLALKREVTIKAMSRKEKESLIRLEDQGVVQLRYKATAKKAPATTFSCPLIVSIPKDKYKTVVFIENRTEVKCLSQNPRGCCQC